MPKEVCIRRNFDDNEIIDVGGKKITGICTSLNDKKFKKD